VRGLRGRARRLRREQTDAERKLWWRLRARQLGGAKFRRQHLIGGHVVDFCCPDGKLVVEVDGGQHATAAEADGRRTFSLVQRGYRVLRFWDHDVLTNVDSVSEQIAEALDDPHPRPLPGRERDMKQGG
jgi:very-short-patch-repair endonuclease